MNQKWIILLRFFFNIKNSKYHGVAPLCPYWTSHCCYRCMKNRAIKQKFRIWTLQYLHQPTRGYRGPNIWCEGSFNQRNENLPHIKSIIADITQLWRLVHGFFSQVIFFLGGASRRLEPRVFCLMEREVNWREPFTPTLCLHSGRSCQEGTYDKIRSPQNHGPPRPAEADAAVTCAEENIKPPDIYQTSGSETRSEEENHFKWISCQKHFHFWRRFFTASRPCHRCSGFWTKKKDKRLR